MSAVNKSLDRRAATKEGSLLRPAINLVPIDRQHPRILYVTGELRVVLRALNDYREGYVDIERRGTNAMHVEHWSHVEGLSLAVKEHNPNPREEILVHFLRTLVPELQA